LERTPKFNGPHEYYKLWKSATDSPEDFWSEMTEKSRGDIYWFKKHERAFERKGPRFKWFVGGTTNTGYNCIDYKLSRYGEKAAYIQETPELGISRKITYSELADTVTTYASALKNLGITRGDRVLLYMPNCIEAAIMLQACARLGIISTCVFSGFSPQALSDRIQLTRPKLIFTQDFSLRRGKRIELKQSVDHALELCPETISEGVRYVVINPIDDEKTSLHGDRDITLAEFEATGRGDDAGYTELDANDPLLIMCTSGTTAEPKPIVHVHGGFQIWTYWTAKWTYGMRPEDVIFNTSDIGWIVGQSYLVFAPLLAGCTAVLYDGVPDFPQRDMWWNMIEKHRATLLWTSPSGARTLRGLGREQAEKHDLSSIERTVIAGEILNPEVWSWMNNEVFQRRIPVFDHMWQTEVPGSLFGYPYGVNMPDFKPGSAGLPLPGVVPEIVNEHDGRPCGTNEKGILLLREPLPGMTQTIWEDHDRYIREYWGRHPDSENRYCTGDLAYLDEDGYIWFCGRSDEVIKIAAHRIGPGEVESALVSHPAVNEAGVFGIPDERRGQVAVAFVVLNAGFQPSNELASTLVGHVRNIIGPIVVFNGIEFVSSVPKTRSGKIMRRLMKALWTGEEPGDLTTLENETSIDEIKRVISERHQL
jgi:acetyl-CoA synthetase